MLLTRENQASHSLVNLYKTANLYLVDTPPFPMGYRLKQVRLYFNLLSNLYKKATPEKHSRLSKTWKGCNTPFNYVSV